LFDGLVEFVCREHFAKAIGWMRAVNQSKPIRNWTYVTGPIFGEPSRNGDAAAAHHVAELGFAARRHYLDEF